MQSFFGILGVLAFTVICYPIAQGTNEFAKVAVGGLVLGSLAVYFSPVYVAYTTRHPHRLPIMVLTVIGGWTVAGWIVALVWAYTRTDSRAAESDSGMPSRAFRT